MMDPRPLRMGSLVLACVAVVSCATSHSGPRSFGNGFPCSDPTPCDKSDHDHLIKVTQAGVSCPDVYIKGRKHKITWCAYPEYVKLKVIIEDDPFDDLHCEDNRCTAYWVKKMPTTEQTYKYSTYYDGTQNSDPNIIIRP
jgi:hypothetical protein